MPNCVVSFLVFSRRFRASNFSVRAHLMPPQASLKRSADHIVAHRGARNDVVGFVLQYIASIASGRIRCVDADGVVENSIAGDQTSAPPALDAGAVGVCSIPGDLAPVPARANAAVRQANDALAIIAVCS